MASTLQPTALAGPTSGNPRSLHAISAPDAPERGTPPAACSHCGEPCPPGAFRSDGDSFCCLGCQTVFSLLKDTGLTDFYQLGERPGVRVKSDERADRWAFLDDPSVAGKLLEYQDARSARVTLHLPAIHCVACIWLLENLFRLNPGIGRSRVNFGRREVSVTYAPVQVRLSEVASLLASLGYEPELTLAELDRPAPAVVRLLGLRIAVAGFAFGNIMLFSLPQYFGLDSFSGPSFRTWFGWLSLILALPAVVFSAADYWRSAFTSLRQRALTLDVPIAAGLAALYGQSVWEVLTRTGEGYFDSLCGLIFFLLCGRAFQQKSHDRLGFDRDYKGFFPLAVLRRTAAGEETVAISSLEVGDRLIVRHGELVPADARLHSGEGLIDYSFVTGEAEAVARHPGDHLYAGGRQVGGAIEVETVKPVSQSYLTSLWNDEAFRKDRDNTFATLTNRYSRRFTLLVVAIAAAAAVGWAGAGDAGRGLKAFISVLIVACPCALALAAPFTLGTAQRLLGRRGVFLRNSHVLETMARIDTIVFDKTGTLTAVEAAPASFHGSPLAPGEIAALGSICRQSAHPYSRRIARTLSSPPDGTGIGVGVGAGVGHFEEITGQGISARVGDHDYRLGSPAWVADGGGVPDTAGLPEGGVVCVAIDGRYRGAFVLENRLRPEVDQLLRGLSGPFELALLSGDNARERDRFGALFGDSGRLHFNQTPVEKLGFIRRLQADRRRVMMVGDGLNDAGALRQSEVGVAVVEGVGKFSPASDVILDAVMVPWIGRIADFSRRTTRVVRAGFLVSAAYNVVGVAIAAAGLLSPIVCAVLMPLSSVSVVLVAIGATHLAAHRTGLAGSAGRTSISSP